MRNEGTQDALAWASRGAACCAPTVAVPSIGVQVRGHGFFGLPAAGADFDGADFAGGLGFFSRSYWGLR